MTTTDGTHSLSAKSATRANAALLAAGAVPLAAGAVVPLDGTEIDAAVPACPFRAATGIPCPLCGGTRAIALAAHGDGRFLSYGAVWVLVAIAAVVAGAVALIRGRTRPWWPAGSRRPLAIGAAVIGLAWAWAIAHADSIGES
jgi:hypothetical protein